MIRLKILAALFSVVVAVTEEIDIFSPTAADPIKQEEPLEITTASLSSPRTEQPEIEPSIPESLTVTASVYFPEPNQTDSTPFITADGSRINKRNPKGHRWIAVSRDLHARWGGELSFGDSLMISGLSEELDGVYVVRDIMNRRMRNKIDILVGRQDKIMGLWDEVQVAKLN